VIRVFIVAEIRLYRDGLALLLGRKSAIEVVGTAARWPEAEASLKALSPDVVLLDMVTHGSLGAVREILSFSTPKIVALAVPDAEDQLLALAEAGISGYVTRDDSFETMVAAIESVARGELLTTPRMAAVLLERVNALTAARRPAEEVRLTPREQEIAALINDGLSNKAIAQRLRIELPTVKNHVHNILEKLQVHRRAEAAVRFRGLVAGGSPQARTSTQD
jgi:two-component system nitrate/nitrite response regulator NarL